MRVKVLNIGIRIVKAICFLLGTTGFILLFFPALIYWVFTGIDLVQKYLDFTDGIEIKQISQKQ